MSAVQLDGRLSVYRRGGAPGWSRITGQNPIAGRAAWRADRALAVWERSDVSCPACPERVTPYPSTWRLTFLNGSTGEPLPATGYPVLRSALGAGVVAWRGDTAYAIVTYSTSRSASGDASAGGIELVRLVPGAAEPQTVLTAPPGTTSMGVATDYVDTLRPTGSPETGVNMSEVLGRTVTTALCLAPLVVPLLIWVFLRRRPAVTPPGSARR
ncbi:MAG TPA: hypothetical protein VFB84_09205 [Micromonosporaceae bacterium]|nr:hypothetical protein [Micromonosporaceae bacterium]